MLRTLANAWKDKELKGKLLFTIMILVVYRIGACITVPFVTADFINLYMSQSGGIFDFINILSGGAFAQATLFALGVSPYITASIVIQLLAVAIPALERLSKEGEEGRKKMEQITRYSTVALSLITSIGYYFYLKNMNVLTHAGKKDEWFYAIVIIACYCAGSSLVMWLAEKINEKGIGNGISMILLANILSRGASIATTLFHMVKSGELKNIIIAIVTVLGALAMLYFIVFISHSERRIPVQYAKKVVGRKMYGGQSSNIPIKLNMTGVMPIIFANAIVTIPTTLAMFVTPKEGTFWYGFVEFFSADSWFYAVMTFVLVIVFAYFYTAISFNPIEVAGNLQKNGGSVPGIRPGRPTSDYIAKVLSRITLIGALALSIICVLPLVANIITDVNMAGLAFGGSSVIIVVGVILELVNEIEAQMTMRHYKGFLD